MATDKLFAVRSKCKYFALVGGWYELKLFSVNSIAKYYLRSLFLSIVEDGCDDMSIRRKSHGKNFVVKAEI